MSIDGVNVEQPFERNGTSPTVDHGESIMVRQADLGKSEDAGNVLRLLDSYAMHPMGSGAPLPARVREEVIDGLRAHPTTLIFLAFAGDTAVGLANCFVGYSTFQAKPLVNIHDLSVQDDYRGCGIGGLLIEAVIAHATARGWCAVTLEVRDDNPARRLYARRGFQGLEEPPVGSTMLFGKLNIEGDSQRPQQ